MKLLYKPFKMIAALIAARIGKTIFRAVWSRIDKDEPPSSTAPNASMAKIVGAKALEAATMAGVAAAADHVSAEVFERLTGVWPDKQREEEQPARTAR